MLLYETIEYLVSNKATAISLSSLSVALFSLFISFKKNKFDVSVVLSEKKSNLIMLVFEIQQSQHFLDKKLKGIKEDSLSEDIIHGIEIIERKASMINLHDEGQLLCDEKADVLEIDGKINSAKKILTLCKGLH